MSRRDPALRAMVIDFLREQAHLPGAADAAEDLASMARADEAYYGHGSRTWALEEAVRRWGVSDTRAAGIECWGYDSFVVGEFIPRYSTRITEYGRGCSWVEAFKDADRRGHGR